ncbi:hypothetical protein QR680_011086 [Steinernema hermaphroditum]|uniref:7TM GPCR serpentine receptor class x (Srx) domain-containing protein n=1 Tax=Steinernema hermaphroditum TaxID=289476 RepID=A0AA39MCR9_9BILA|nr:hypothetical protein QR680_011086 [Steinernema hermaphroditum]
MNASAFVFGFEMQGRGEPTAKDIVLGVLIQPKNIPIELGFIAYIIGYVGALTACLLHQAVSANRLIAVFKPLQYKYIFSKANCIKMIIACLLPVPFILTLYFDRSVQIQKIGKDDQQLRRDIRFFMQTSMQNVTMVITSICITVANNMYTMDLEVWRILGFYSIIVTHLTNALSLIIFNPEVRRRLFSSKVSFSETSQIQSTSHARQSI